MFKRGILIVVLTMGVYASNDPFAVEQSLEKIEKEEDDLLNTLSKEQQLLKKNNENTTKKMSITEVKEDKPNLAIEKKVESSPRNNESQPTTYSPKIEEKKIVVQNKEVKTDEIPIITQKPNKEKPNERVEPTPPRVVEKKSEPVVQEEPKKIIVVTQKPKKDTSASNEARISKEQIIRNKIKMVDEKIKDLEHKLELEKQKAINEANKIATNKAKESNRKKQKETQIKITKTKTDNKQTESKQTSMNKSRRIVSIEKEDTRSPDRIKKELREKKRAEAEAKREQELLEEEIKKKKLFEKELEAAIFSVDSE